MCTLLVNHAIHEMDGSVVMPTHSRSDQEGFRGNVSPTNASRKHKGNQMQLSSIGNLANNNNPPRKQKELTTEEKKGTSPPPPRKRRELAVTSKNNQQKQPTQKKGATKNNQHKANNSNSKTPAEHHSERLHLRPEASACTICAQPSGSSKAASPAVRFGAIGA